MARGQHSDGGGVSVEETALWQRYVSTRDPNVRDQLVQRHLNTAQKIAASLYANRINNTIDFADYLQYARVGLLEAVDRYDPARAASFTTFATYRIRGSILNGVEKETEKAAQHAQRRRALRERLKSVREGVEPNDAFTSMVDVAISLALGYLLEESGIWRPSGEDHAADPYRSLELKRLGERMVLIVKALPEREQLIVRYHYFEHMEFIAIAGLLGISKGRVSQLHARALKLIRDAYRAVDRFDVHV